MSQNVSKCLKISKFLRWSQIFYIFGTNYTPKFQKRKRIPREFSLSQQCAAVKITWSEMTEAPQPIRGKRAIHLHVSAVASWPPFGKGINYRQEGKYLKSRKSSCDTVPTIRPCSSQFGSFAQDCVPRKPAFAKNGKDF